MRTRYVAAAHQCHAADRRPARLTDRIHGHTPLKPSAFKAKIPAPPKNEPSIRQDPETLVVIVGKDRNLTLNHETTLGTTDETQPLIERLSAVFQQRIANTAVSSNVSDDIERPFPDRIQRTVFIKAPGSIDYGSVTHVVDAVAIAGAYPISLQIDNLE